MCDFNVSFIRVWIVKIVFVLGLSISIQPAFSADPITGKLLVEELRSAGISIAQEFGEQAERAANAIGANLNNIADKVEDILGDKITQPIKDLTGVLRLETDRGIAALNETTYVLQKTSQCLTADVEHILAAFQGTITTNVSSVIPWTETTPRVYSIRPIGGNTPYAIRVRDGVQTIELKGANFLSEESCGSTVEITKLEGSGSTPTAELVGIDPETITAKLSGLNDPGVYGLKIGLRKKGLFWCKKPKYVNAAFAVLHKGEFNASYEVTPFCQNVVTVTETKTGGRRNGSCTNDRRYDQVFTFNQGGVTLQNFNRTYTSHRATPVFTRNGNTVRVTARLPDKGGWACPNGDSRINFRLNMVGSYLGEPIQNDTLQQAFAEPMKFGESRTQSISDLITCNVPTKYSVNAKIVSSDGTTISIPTETSPVQNPSLIGIAHGAKFQWDNATKQITVSAPPDVCGT